jgi:hypothetical protein
MEFYFYVVVRIKNSDRCHFSMFYFSHIDNLFDIWCHDTLPVSLYNTRQMLDYGESQLFPDSTRAVHTCNTNTELYNQSFLVKKNRGQYHNSF